jgi:signal transduction histidine kinase
MVLSLNNAYYQVREQESDTFYKMFRAELEATDLDDMLGRFTAVLQEYTGADEARVSLAAPARKAARRWLAEPHCSAGGKVPAELGWARKFATVWSVPLASGTADGGVMQFGFRNGYTWLPRERELLVAAAERCRRAAEKALLLANLAEREEQIRLLAEHMVEVEEAERRRISRELHDEAGQSLLCVRLQLEVLENRPGRDAETRGKLAETRGMVEHSIIEIRRLIAALSPAVLEQIGLAAALRQLVGRFRQVHPAVVHLKVPRRLELPRKTEIIVYRLAQECLQNAAKYSHAQNVNLSVQSADGHLRMRIADDGVGFDVEEALSRRDCYGLSGLRERVTLLGGRLAVMSRRAADDAARGGVHAVQGRGLREQPRGTAIDIFLPLGGPAARRAQGIKQTAEKTAGRATGRQRVGS